MNEPSINVDFCCTCLKVGTIGDKFVSLSFEPPEDISYKCKLKSCVPEMGLENTEDCFLCKPCTAALETAYTFRCMCLRTETRLEDFRKTQLKNSGITDKVIKQELIESTVDENKCVSRKPTNVGYSSEGSKGFVHSPTQSECFPGQSKGFAYPSEGFVYSAATNKEMEEMEDSKIEIVKDELGSLLTESIGSAIDINIHIFNEQSQHSRKINSTVDIYNSLNAEKFPRNKEENKFEEMKQIKPLTDPEIIAVSCKTIPDLQNCPPEALACQVTLEKIEVVELPVIIPSKKVIQKSTKGKAFWCSVCKKDIYRKERYHAHVLRHSNVRAYKCEICRRGFFSSETLSKHRKTCDGSKVAVKNSPKKKFFKKPPKIMKIEKEDEDDYAKSYPLRVNKVPVVGTIRKSTRQHTPSKKLCNLNDTIFRCKLCKYQSYWKQKYQVHLLHHTNDKQFACTECSKRFYEKWELNRHMRTIHAQTKNKTPPKRLRKSPPQSSWLETNFLEPAVSLIVNRAPTVITPIIQSIQSLAETSTDPEITFSCKTCSVHFQTHDQLTLHTQTHEVSTSAEPAVQLELPPKVTKKKIRKKFFCNVCNLEFSSRDHANVHTGAKPYKCKVCEKQFAACTTLVKHNRTHQDRGWGSSKKIRRKVVSPQKKSFACEICKKKFAKKELVYSHNCQNASGDAVYRCQICKNAFIGRAALIEHMGMHVSQTENATE